MKTITVQNPQNMIPMKSTKVQKPQCIVLQLLCRGQQYLARKRQLATRPQQKKVKLTRKYQGSGLYSTKYQQAWEKEFAFVCPSKSSNYTFHCKACNKDASVSHQRIIDIQRHTESKMHQLRITSLRAQPTLGFRSVSDPVHVSASAAEVRNTVVIEQHNASLCLADHYCSHAT